MVKRETISEILSLYKKHGWSLRRVLLSEKTKANLSGASALFFGGAEIISSEIDAAWFTRDSGKTMTAWELRHLSENPFAVFEAFDRETSGEFLNAKLSEIENRLKNRLTKTR